MSKPLHLHSVTKRTDVTYHSLWQTGHFRNTRRYCVFGCPKSFASTTRQMFDLSSWRQSVEKKLRLRNTQATGNPHKDDYVRFPWHEATWSISTPPWPRDFAVFPWFAKTHYSAPVNNMRTLKFKIQPTVTLFTTVNHCSGPLMQKIEAFGSTGSKVTFVRCDWQISIHFVGFFIFAASLLSP